MPADSVQSSLALLFNISRQLASSFELQTVLENVITLSMQSLGAERGNVFVLNNQKRPIEAVMMYNEQRVPYTMQELAVIVDRGMAGWVLRNDQAVLTPDTSLDERWVRRPDDQSDRTGAKSAICVPLKARGQMVGVLTLVHPEPGFFNEAHFNLLQSIGDQAGIAIYNARLVDSLQAATRRYHELFENNLDPILVTDFNGKILEVNRRAEQMDSAAAGKLVGEVIFSTHTPNLLTMENGLERLKAGETVSYESMFHPRAGQAFPVEIYVYRVRLLEEEVLQWTVRDITARKELDIVRNDLSAMVYHDLRSPLSNVISSLDILQGLLKVEPGSNVQSIFGIAVRSTSRMQRLISSLLDINRLEAGQPITNQKLVDVTVLVQEVADSIQPTLISKHQKIQLTLAEAIPLVLIDEDMVRRVLINLLDNATKFSPVKGEMRLQVEVSDGMVRFCVEDSGPGIPSDAAEAIFEKFRRLNVHHGPKGLGLGLAFCRLAVQAHGGRIWVESDGKNGSRFYFTLPAG
jgi:PAS domain S-box-containing protein